MKFFWLGIFFLNFHFCSGLIPKKNLIKKVEFNYSTISENYFIPGNEKPFPLTVQRGNNLHNSISGDGKYLFYSTDIRGNYDIYFRDLKSSSILPITDHPSAEHHPSVSPDGKKLVYVSDEIDGNGDLILVTINPEEIIKDGLLGKKFFPKKKVNLTNPNEDDNFIDTEPSFSPDGKKIVYSSNRLTPAIQNILILDIDKPNINLQISDGGGMSPSFSPDGKKIIYISFKYSKKGDVVLLNLDSGLEEKITTGNNLYYSPTISTDNKFLYYTVINEDTNNDRVINENDASRIVRREISTGREFFLTPKSYSSFDSKYSSFNGGSVVYSAALFNSINIYFIPSTGMIPRKEEPLQQLKLIEKYLDSDNETSIDLALDSMKIFFENHPLFEIFNAKTESLKLIYFFEKKNTEKYHREYEYLTKTDRKDSSFLYRKALAFEFKNKSTGKNTLKELENLNLEFLKLGEKSQTYGAFLEILAGQYARNKDFESSVRVYNQILNDIPEYYNSNGVRLKMGEIVHSSKPQKIPEIYFALLDSGLSIENKVEVLKNIENKIKSGRNPDEKIKLTDTIIQENALESRSEELYYLVKYIKSESYHEMKKFSESNQILDSITKPVPVIDPVCAFTPGCKQKLPCEEDRVCLQVHLLKSKNLENQGNTIGSFNELKIFLQGYDDRLNVEIDREDLEKNLRYFEIKAREYESQRKLRESAINFFFNTENMFLLKEKNIHVGSINKKYGNYYYKKMVDSILLFAREQANEERNNFLNQINILKSDRVNLPELINKFTALIPENRLTTPIKSTLTIDLGNDIVLGKEGKPDNGLKLIEEHFTLARPRSRPVLYLSALYGYAYYQIQKSIEYDVYYRKKGRFSKSIKEKILEGFKIAENELQWIIFADQEFNDAYQLLGFLYQYIDKSKENRYGEESTEGEAFEEVYEKFFPENLIEKNIDLYNQILTFLGDSATNKVLSDIHLNLGNSFFLLNNYKRAAESYSHVDSYSRYILPEYQFENSEQRIFYHYNFSRALLYNGEYSKAGFELDKILKSSTDSFQYGSVENEKENLAIIYVLKSLSQTEEKQYGAAITSLKKALSLNNEISILPKLSIYNALSYNYILNNEMHLGLYYIHLARSEYNKLSKGIIGDLKLNPWDLLLPESIRVIGEGKIPSKIPDKLQFLWTSGNEILLYQKQKEYSKVQEVVQEREDYIIKNGLKHSKIGKELLFRDKNLLGTIYYKVGNYDSAYKIFSKIYQENPSNFSVIKKLVYSILNSNNSKFSEFNYGLGLLTRFENETNRICLSKIKNADDLSDYEDNCRNETKSKYPEIETLKGNLYFSLSEAHRDRDLSLSIYYLGLYSNTFRSLSSSEEFKYQRNHFEKIRILFNSLNGEDKENLENKLLEIKYLVKEYKPVEEGLIYYTKEIQYSLKRKDYKKVNSLINESAYYFELAIFSKTIKESELIDYSESILQYYFETRNLSKLILWKAYIQGVQAFISFINFKFRFENENLNLDYQVIWEQINHFQEKLQAYRKADLKNLSSFRIEMNEEFNKLNENIKKFISKYPNLKYIFQIKTPESYKNSTLIADYQSKIIICTSNHKNCKDINKDEFSGDFLNSILGKEREVKSFLTIKPENREIFRFLNGIPNLSISYFPGTGNTTESNLNKKDLNVVPATKENIYLSDSINIFLSNSNYENPFGETKENFINLKQLIQKNYLINSYIFNEIVDGINYNILGLYLRAFVTDNIYFLGSNKEIIFSEEKKPETSNLPSISSIFSMEVRGDYKESILSINQLIKNEKDKEKLINYYIIKARLQTKYFDPKKSDYFYLELQKKIGKNENLSLEMIKNCILKTNTIFCKNDIYTELSKSGKEKIDFLEMIINRELSYESINKQLIVEATESIDLIFLDLSQVLLNNLYFIESYEYLIKIDKKNIGKNWERYYSDIYFLSEFLGFQKIEKIYSSENIYSYIANRDYKNIYKSIEDLKNKGNSDSIADFRIKLYETFVKLEIGESFNPNTLKTEKLSTGESIYSVLDLKDKLLIFYIFLKSIANQKGDELNQLVQNLLKKENGIDDLLLTHLNLSFAEGAFQRNDMEASGVFLAISKASMKENWNQGNLQYRRNNLERKIDFIQKGIFEKIELSKKDIYNYLLQKIINGNEDPYLVLNDFLLENKDQLFSSTDKRELYDLILLLQKFALTIDSTNLFLDLSFYKDKIGNLNERFYSSKIYFNDLPKFLKISEKLQEKIPDNQMFIALVPYLNNVYRLKVSKNSISGYQIQNINLKLLKSKMFAYYEQLKKSGSSTLEREELETKFRNMLKLDKKHRNYIYLSTFLIKLPIEMRGDDNFFIVTSPELLINNPQKNYNNYLSEKNSIQLKLSKLSNPLLNELSKIELSRSKESNEIIYILQNRIYLKDKTNLFIDSEPLLKFQEKNKEGFWIIAGMDIFYTSFQKDDFNSVVQHLEKSYNGPFLFSLTPQFEETDSIYFLKEFINETDFFMGIRGRFVNAIRTLKYSDRKEISYIGFRLGTNCFLVE